MIEGLRVGSGFDVHAFCDNRKLILGGIEIPFEKGLEGHSDADVLIHAMVDSILGALGEGDIGIHFPPSDNRWKNASSDIFLMHAATLVRERGGRILNIDTTILLEEPRLRPHREKIIKNLSQILDLESSRVHLKATTTEKLGFVGRQEGIVAHAVCLLYLNPDKRG